MQYDDRLATVLRPKVNGAASARIQYRQLLDLLGTSPAEARNDGLDAGYQRLAELSAALPAADRIAALTEPALRLRSPRLVAVLSQAEPAVASCAVRVAQLSDEQWLDLIPALPPSARAAMGGRRDIGTQARALLARLGIGDQALPPVQAEADQTIDEAPAPTDTPSSPVTDAPAEGIGAIVRRIEAFRRARDEAGPATLPGDSPRLPLGEDSTRSAPDIHSFDFLADGAGRVTWSEPRMAPMVVGIDLSEYANVRGAIRQHQPIRAAMVTLPGAPAIAGEWQVDASPSFAPHGGSFVGHLGRFRRLAAGEGQAGGYLGEISLETDRLRQILHELRTPVNAIQGFAEIIQQQLFGPTPHEYRALAAVIAADSARMLAGFAELERFARLESNAIAPASAEAVLAPGESDLAVCVAATVQRLEPHTAPRASGFEFAAPDDAFPLAIAPIEIERLCWRLLATLAGSAAEGEVLQLELRHSGRQAQLTMQLPAALAHLDDDALLHAGTDVGVQTLAAGMFGIGFALRLAAGEAGAAGGRLERAQESLNLLLPIAHRAAPNDTATLAAHAGELNIKR